MKPLQIGVLAVALSAGSAIAQRYEPSVRVIVAKQTSDNRLLIAESASLPKGVAVHSVMNESKLGMRITTPLTVVRVPSEKLPAARPMPEGIRAQMEKMAVRDRDLLGRAAESYSEDCWTSCSFVMEVFYESGADSFFVFDRYPGQGTDEVASIAAYNHEYVADLAVAETSAGWIPGFDLESSIPEGGANRCVRPEADDPCMSVLWGLKYTPSTLSGTMVLLSEGRTRSGPCNPDGGGCEPVFDATAVSVALHSY